jgi:hypothetical protein
LSIAALAPISPENLKAILELFGYRVVACDSYNWILAQNATDTPIILPMLGDLVALEILMDTVFTKAGMDLRTYLALKRRVEALAQTDRVN